VQTGLERTKTAPPTHRKSEQGLLECAVEATKKTCAVGVQSKFAKIKNQKPIISVSIPTVLSCIWGSFLLQLSQMFERTPRHRSTPCTFMSLGEQDQARDFIVCKQLRGLESSNGLRLWRWTYAFGHSEAI